MAIQSPASKAIARQNTVKIPQRTKTGKASIIFFLEKESKIAREKALSTSFHCIPHDDIISLGLA
jgi:hypothetical protein